MCPPQRRSFPNQPEDSPSHRIHLIDHAVDHKHLAVELVHGPDTDIASGFQLVRGGTIIQQGVDDSDLSDTGLCSSAPAEQHHAADHGEK